MQPGPLGGERRQRCQSLIALTNIGWILEGHAGGQVKIQKIKMKNEDQ